MVAVVGSGANWSNHKKKEKIKKVFYTKNIVKLMKKILNSSVFQGLIHEVSLIALGSLRNYKATHKRYSLCAK